MINLRHLSTDELQELSRRYELEQAVLSEVVNAGIVMDKDYIASNQNEKQRLHNKLFVVDKEIRERSEDVLDKEVL